MPLEVDTYDWDTAFAIRFADANTAIVNGWANVNSGAKNVSQTDDGYSISAVLGPWQLCEGGDGRNVRMTIPVVSGSYTSNGPATDLTGTVFKVEINLDYVPNPKDESNQQLKVTTKGEATTVLDVMGINLGEIGKAVLKQVFGKWLAANLGEFNHVFHDINISEAIDKDSDWAFLTPTAVSYAVTDQGSLATSVFGVLTMTERRPAPNNHQVSPNAISDGENSGFNISGSLFTNKMLLSAAALQFQQPESVTSLKKDSLERQKAFDLWVAQSFCIANDGMSVTNSSPMTFGTFLDDSGTSRTLVVDATDFKLSVNYGLIEIDFTDLKYNYSPGIDVHINYKQHFNVYLADGKDAHGKPTKIFALKNIDRDCNISITKSREVQITEIVMGIALSIAGAVLGGLAGEAIGTLIKGTAQAAVASSEATAEAVSMSLVDVASEASDESIDLLPEAGAQAGAEAAGQAGGKMSGFLARIAPKLAGAVVGAGAGATLAAIPDYVVLSASGAFNELPTFDLFAAQCIQAHRWPGQTGYTLKSIRLATSFQIGGDLIL